MMDKCTWSAYLCSAEAPTRRKLHYDESGFCVCWQPCQSCELTPAKSAREQRPILPPGAASDVREVPGRAYRDRDGARRAEGVSHFPFAAAALRSPWTPRPATMDSLFEFGKNHTFIKNLKVFFVCCYTLSFLYADLAQALRTSVGGYCRDHAPPSVACRRGLRATRWALLLFFYDARPSALARCPRLCAPKTGLRTRVSLSTFLESGMRIITAAEEGCSPLGRQMMKVHGYTSICGEDL